jgi:hypothetical protein
MRALVTSLLLAFLVAANLHTPLPLRADDPTADGKGARNPEAKPRPKFTLGKETTFALGPLDAGGRVDYVAALNERLRAGVTPASNANVLLWKVFGPRPEGSAVPRVFFRWLGVEAPPEQGDYFLGLGKYAREQLGAGAQADFEALYGQLDRAREAPWTAKEYPAIAGWLKANEKPLALVLEATRRPHYYSPLVPSEAGGGRAVLLSALLPAVQRCRELASILPARAMRYAGAGRHADAWQDLLACHRLGRHVARGGTIIEGLVGFAIENISCAASLNYLGRARLTTRQIKDCLSDLRRLPPLPGLADKVDLTERFLLLEIAMAVERDGFKMIADLGLAPTAPKAADAQARRLLEDIDWDTALRAVNRWYNRLAAALCLKDREARQERLNQFDKDVGELRFKLASAGGLGKGLLAARDSRARGKLLGDTLFTLLLSNVGRVQQATERAEQVQRNLRVAFALSAYQREHGRYPEKLDALAPAYLPRIPQDIFTGKALIYHPVPSAYLLYSVGVNGQDDQGRTYDDDPPGDDLRVRMPLPKLK